MKSIKSTRKIYFASLVALFAFLAMPTASAYKLTYYYDPDTGNVSFDTSETRSGETLIYLLRVFPDETTIRFRPENHVRLTSSPLASSDPDVLQEVTHVNPMRGYLTIGDILPIGLSEELWQSLFTLPTGTSVYAPGLGMPGSENITFVYGQPDREFDNRWDVIDPDTLDWATAASLVYRQGSGEVFLDTRGPNSGYISGILLKAYSDFITENYTSPWDSQFNYAFDVRLSLLGDAVEPGIYSLGRILESDLSQEEYTSRFESAKFFGKSGLLGDLDLETEPGMAFSLVYVPIPEPTSALLISLAGTVLLSTRKKTFFL